MALPLLAPTVAAAAPAAAVGGGAILSSLLQGLLSGVAEGAIQSATAPGALTPAPAQGGSGSKFMITLQDVKEIQRFVDQENFRRESLRQAGLSDLPLLDAQEIIADRERELRRSAAESGAREYAIKQLDVEGATRPAVATALGAATVGAQQALADAIESVASRPKYEGSPVLTEIARAI
jgi:hypothetical protein